MIVEKVTSGLYWTRYGNNDRPKLVVTAEATEQDKATAEGLELFGIWEIIREGA